MATSKEKYSQSKKKYWEQHVIIRRFIRKLISFYIQKTETNHIGSDIAATANTSDHTEIYWQKFKFTATEKKDLKTCEH
jgi:hypothetical protein